MGLLALKRKDNVYGVLSGYHLPSAPENLFRVGDKEFFAGFLSGFSVGAWTNSDLLIRVIPVDFPIASFLVSPRAGMYVEMPEAGHYRLVAEYDVKEIGQHNLESVDNVAASMGLIVSSEHFVYVDAVDQCRIFPRETPYFSRACFRSHVPPSMPQDVGDIQLRGGMFGFMIGTDQPCEVILSAYMSGTIVSSTSVTDSCLVDPWVNIPEGRYRLTVYNNSPDEYALVLIDAMMNRI